MKEQFVTYEIALKLKELGFDEPCLACYIDKQLHLEQPDYLRSQKKADYIFGPQNVILAPLWQQVIDWFREEYKIRIDVSEIYPEADNYHYAINLGWSYFEGTYYQAREAAILKAIELWKETQTKE